MGNCIGKFEDGNNSWFDFDTPLKKRLRMDRLTRSYNVPVVLTLGLWQTVVGKSTDQSNLFTEFAVKYPKCLHMFDIEYQHDVRQRTNWHRRLIEDIIGNCLARSETTANKLELLLALYSLGVFHAQRGVTISQLMAFHTMSTAFVHRRAVNIEKGREVCVSKAVHHQLENIVEAMQLVINGLQAGMIRYERVMAFARATMDKKASRWKKSKAKKKCFTRTTAVSWRKIAVHLSRL